MPRQPQSTGLFGQTPAAIRQAQINERINQASMIGNLGPGGHGALAGGMFGRAAGNALGMLAGQDVSDPRLQQAQAMQEIEAQITQMGLEPGTREFTETLGQLATMRLGVGAAAPIVRKAQQLEMERAEIEAVRNPPSVAAAQNRFQALIQVAQMSPGAAEVIAPMKEVSEAVLKGVLSPADVDAKIKQALFASNNDVAEARKKVAKLFEKAPGVYIDQRQKLAGIRDEVLTREGAKAEAGKKISLENAGPVLKQYIQLLKNRPPVSDFGAMAQWVADVKANEGNAGQAYARLRNPTGIVTDKDVIQGLKDLPGIGNIAMNNLDASISSLEKFTSLKFGNGGDAVPKSAADLGITREDWVNATEAERAAFK